MLYVCVCMSTHTDTHMLDIVPAYSTHIAYLPHHTININIACRHTIPPCHAWPYLTVPYNTMPPMPYHTISATHTETHTHTYMHEFMYSYAHTQTRTH